MLARATAAYRPACCLPRGTTVPLGAGVGSSRPSQRQPGTSARRTSPRAELPVAVAPGARDGHPRCMSDTSPEQVPLEHVREDWQTALCVVAHPDDMEFGAAAAVARWTGMGKRVVYCMVTSGEAGIDGMHPEQARQVREYEQVESARIVGVEEVDFLAFSDGILEYGVPLRRAIAGVVRRHRPDIVLTNNFRDRWG